MIIHYADKIESPVPRLTGGNDTIIIVSAAVGASVLLLALVLCAIVLWCCLIKNNPKRVYLRRTRHNNYKGNNAYVLPYTIYGKPLKIKYLALFTIIIFSQQIQCS